MGKEIADDKVCEDVDRPRGSDSSLHRLFLAVATIRRRLFAAAGSPQRLANSTFNLSMVRRDPIYPLPISAAATPAEAVYGVSKTRPVSDWQPTLARAGGCRARPDSAVALERRPGRGGPWLGGCRIRPLPGRRPGSWALATGPGGALLARRLVSRGAAGR